MNLKSFWRGELGHREIKGEGFQSTEIGFEEWRENKVRGLVQRVDTM